jgi:divalent metal cation (Fe/Co/Zn/Cd) transporter
MRPIPQQEYSPAQERLLTKARHLEYLTIAYLVSVVVLMYIVMGSSQAMKTAWIEDCLSLIPPVCFLLGAHVCWREPSNRFPYGLHRAISVVYLGAALALLLTGGFLLVDALITLFRREHPTIGMQSFFGVDLWLGWWMLPVLLWGVVPPVLLGRAKLRFAEDLNDKILVTDGEMNKADWMTAAAAMGGVLGIGFGLWWADAVAAALISFDILHDGWKQTKDAVTGLMNRAPTSVHGDRLTLPEDVKALLCELPWVESADVRLYEVGHLIFGEGFIRSAADRAIEPEDLRSAMRRVRDLDWRLKGFALTVDPSK